MLLNTSRNAVDSNWTNDAAQGRQGMCNGDTITSINISGIFNFIAMRPANTHSLNTSGASWGSKVGSERHALSGAQLHGHPPGPYKSMVHTQNIAFL